MAFCGPSCAIPSCASAPVVGLGSTGCGPLGYGYGGIGSAYGGSGLAESASSLGILAGINPSCISQTLPSEVVVQPPPVVVTVPGAILSATCEPVTVGGITPCAPGGISRGRLGRAGYLGSNGTGPCFLPC